MSPCAEKAQAHLRWLMENTKRELLCEHEAGGLDAHTVAWNAIVEEFQLEGSGMMEFGGEQGFIGFLLQMQRSGFLVQRVTRW